MPHDSGSLTLVGSLTVGPHCPHCHVNTCRRQHMPGSTHARVNTYRASRKATAATAAHFIRHTGEPSAPLLHAHPGAQSSTVWHG